ncbi:siderophore ferric iron reductase [Vibrio sp. YMD68]|uniref:siderophore ferric iron reductase n=1 Tax=Vibrio sp. YMD68 TaxID=3042300 RepID=UPI00249B824E|nr:siderophore ferric iron reductase [Vibrio sp. YMD68]WGW01430.1 siderophore ferric iron reductase [Vibrio sp. YMD68]
MHQDLTMNQLFEFSKQITPYLAGKLESLPNNPQQYGIIHFDHNSSLLIQDLYENIAKNTPEAGNAYWLTRTWDLLCWQPLYLAFVSVYACQALPDLKRIAQFAQNDFVAGYQFETSDHIHGDQSTLIALAGQDLQTLFEHYRHEMSEWTRIRPGFTHHLLADGILRCIIKLHKYSPELTNHYLLEQAKLWLAACRLPEQLTQSLSVDPATNELKFVRTSCCLVYKCAGRKLCSDCPRAIENKRVPNGKTVSNRKKSTL